MATVLFRSELPRCRADAESIAFFSTPGIEPLYSGVTTSSASATSMRSRRSTTESRDIGSALGPGPGRRAGAVPTPRNSIATPAGASIAAARARAVLYEPLSQAP